MEGPDFLTLSMFGRRQVCFELRVVSLTDPVVGLNGTQGDGGHVHRTGGQTLLSLVLAFQLSRTRPGNSALNGRYEWFHAGANIANITSVSACI